MAQIETLRVGCCIFQPLPITRKWHTWYYSARELLRKAEELGGDWSTNVATVLQKQRIPDSWNSCSIILPRAIRWAGRGLHRRRYVAVFQKVGDEWKVVERALRDGFGRNDFVLSVVDPTGKQL